MIAWVPSSGETVGSLLGGVSTRSLYVITNWFDQGSLFQTYATSCCDCGHETVLIIHGVEPAVSCVEILHLAVQFSLHVSQSAAGIGHQRRPAGLLQPRLPREIVRQLAPVQLLLSSSTSLIEVMASRISNWIRSKRSRKEKEGEPEIRNSGTPEHSRTTPDVRRLVLDAESSILDPSRLKTTVTTVEIQAIEARKTEEHTSSTPAAAALPPERASHAEAESLTASPEDIWDRAYDSLQKDNAELVDAYEKILSNKPSAIDSPPDASEPQNTIERNPDTRRKQMHKLIQDGLQKTKREAAIIHGVGEAAQFVLSAKDMIDAAIQAVPQAALAWTGVCFALQVRRRTDPPS